MIRVAITGARGQIGWEMCRVLHPFVDLLPLSRQALDMNKPELIRRSILELAPDLVINCAAYTAVDRAEQDAESAQRVNGDSVAELGQVGQVLGVPVVHFSTDYVFPGDSARPYCEDDAVGPLSVYGWTKLAGERSLTESGAPYWTIRTSWVYAARGRNFVKAIVARARETGRLRVVNDQRGAPTWARTIAEVLGAMLSQCCISASVLRERISSTQGIYHLASRGETTWFEFARFIVDRAEPALGRTVEIVPVTTEEFPTAALRPAFSLLNTDKLRRTFNVHLPDWRTAAALCLDELAE